MLCHKKYNYRHRYVPNKQSQPCYNPKIPLKKVIVVFHNDDNPGRSPGFFYGYLLLLESSYFINQQIMTYTYKYPRPSLTVDATVFREKNHRYELLLIQRKYEPFEGRWALPGGFVDMDETLEEAVTRELKEETNLTGVELNQLHAFSTLGRDPRGHTISVVFWGVLNTDQEAVAGDDAKNAKWFNLDHLPELAFDHHQVVKFAMGKIKFH